MKPDNKDKIINLSNNRSITQENYEILAKKFKENMQRADHFLYKVGRLFDEAFTKYEHSNPNARKLKDFEVHEKRQEAQKGDRAAQSPVVRLRGQVSDPHLLVRS